MKISEKFPILTSFHINNDFEYILFTSSSLICYMSAYFTYFSKTTTKEIKKKNSFTKFFNKMSLFIKFYRKKQTKN